MTAAEALSRRVHKWHLLFSLVGAALVSWAVPFLLLLAQPVRASVMSALFLSMLTGGLAASLLIRIRLRKHEFLLRAFSVESLGLGQTSLDPKAVRSFMLEPPKLARAWLYPQYAALLLLVTPLRPAPLDLTTAIAVALLTTLILATASLPLLVILRSDFLRVIERAPIPVVQELIVEAEQHNAARRQINRRIVAAVTMPVVFVAVGGALIVNAHLRRDDERFRAETARILARAALELEPGPVETLELAIQEATALGFPAQIDAHGARYGVILERDGIAELTTPLDIGSARVRYDSSTVPVVGAAPLLVALLATTAAALLGLLLGNLLTTDLYYATRRVRALGTHPGLGASGVTLLRRPRFQMVSELVSAIEGLADRFAVFAQAQEDAIRARSAATRTRGLFFATVSHDLKSPLNSILGFTQLVSLERLSDGQQESLQAIHSRARELLALIETILDAARVEEGQLSLVRDEVMFDDLYKGALSKAAELSAGYTLQVYREIETEIPPLLVDRVRVLRAFATLVAYSVRSHKGGKMWIRAERESPDSVRIDIDVPAPEHAPPELEAMLSTQTSARKRDHRGLALGLRLARSVVELHGGEVRVVDRGKKGAMFCVKLPTVARALRRQAATPTAAPTSSQPAATLPRKAIESSSSPAATAPPSANTVASQRSGRPSESEPDTNS